MAVLPIDPTVILYRPLWTVNPQDENSMKLNATSASLLGLLEDCGEMTGGALVREAEVRIGEFWNLTRSQVYRELAALDGAGYIKAGPTGARDARPYRLTRSGRSAFRAWLAAESPNDQTRVGMLVLMAFGRHLPAGRMRALLDEYSDEHRARLASYEELDEVLEAENADPYMRATLSFGLHYERAVLAWLDSLPAGVRDGTL
jgi:DNA-binding PadR family transcriptional regulator